MLKRISLQNICQHHSETVVMGSGLTVVVGPQGSGKSNMLTMALASLTGENPLHGTKQHNVRRGSEPDDPAYVSVLWEDPAGTAVQVIRGYRKKRSSVEVNGEDKGLRKEAEINREIAAALGINPKTVLQMSYVPQGQTDALIMERPTNRTKFVAELLGLQWILDLELKFKDSLAQLRGSLEEDNLEKLRQEIVRRNSIGAKYERSFARKKQLEIEVSEKEAEFEQYSDLLAKARQLDRLRYEMQQCTIKWTAEYKEVEKLSEEKGRLDQEIISIPEEINRLEDLERQQNHYDQRKEIEEKLSDLKKEKASIVQQLVPPDVPDVDKPDEQIPASLEAKRLELNQRYKLVARNKSNCHECGAPIDIKPGEKENLEKQMSEITQELRNYYDVKELWDKCQQRLHTYNHNKEFNEASLQRTEDRILKAGEELKTYADARELGPEELSGLSQLPSLKSRLTNSTNRLNLVKEEIAKLTASISHHSARYSELKNSVEEIQEATESLNKAKQFHAELAELRKEHESQIAKFAVYQTEWSISKDQVKLIIEKIRRQQAQIQSQKLLEEVAEQVKVKNLPRKVLRQFMEGIAERMSDLCYELGQPFSVSVGEDLEFLVTHRDGSLEQAQRLSGGQKACLATVFWLTRLTFGLGKGLPLLVLDEPTANMDEEAVSRFGDMLMRLDPILKQHNQQVVVITHHRQLRACGSYVIDLGEDNHGKI